MSVSKIQMVDLNSQYLKIKPQIDAAMAKVISETNFINGPAVKELQQKMQEKFNVKHVIPCGNGTDALQIALMALDLQEGDEIITSTFTFIATAEVIALLGLKPIFVDVYPDTFGINIEQVKAKISSKTKVIIPVHLYGQTCNMEELNAIAKQNNLFIIEDTAQAINSEYTFNNGETKFAGTIGDIGTTSFFPSKNLGCFGDGGAIFTNNDTLAEKMRMIINHGSKIKYHHEIVGVNSRLDTLQAAILSVKLDYLDEYCTNRQTAADYYSKNLQNIKEIITPTIHKKGTHVFHQYTLRVLNNKRDELKKYLENNGIPTMIYYPISLHKQKAFENYHNGENLAVAENLEKEVISLPMHTELNEETLQFICKHIQDFFNI
jgi:UDP-2-acetamido-2-deoxy-ribo-hexuluronate aminotransferase